VVRARVRGGNLAQPLEAALTQDKDGNRQPEHRQQNPEAVAKRGSTKTFASSGTKRESRTR